jgi:hypothetical protein
MKTTAQIERPTLAETLAELVPLIEFIPGYGPPVLVLLGPWLLLAVVLAGPVAFLLALVTVVAAAIAALTAAVLALVVMPYRLVRHLRRHHARPAGQVAAIGSRVAA